MRGEYDPKLTWMNNIVSNSVNDIDVDKFDYLRRDSYMVNIHGMNCD
jgi:HD superfamily phosphohydrolase